MQRMSGAGADHPPCPLVPALPAAPPSPPCGRTSHNRVSHASAVLELVRKSGAGMNSRSRWVRKPILWLGAEG